MTLSSFQAGFLIGGFTVGLAGLMVNLTILFRAWLTSKPKDLDYDRTLEVLRKL